MAITGSGVRGRRRTIRTRNAERFVALRDAAQRIATGNARTLTVDASADAKYVRFGCWGRGEPFARGPPLWIVP